MTQENFVILNSEDISPPDIHPDADLSGANFSDAYLRNASLSSGGLREANLSGADLSKADLTDAFLYEADLSGASLNKADLTDAFLYEADLSGADLSRADLTNAIFEEADLTDATFEEADLSGADLTNATLPENFETAETGANESRAASNGTNASPDSEEDGDDNPDPMVVSVSEIVAVIDDPKTEAAIITTISESGDITKFGVGHGDEKIVIQLAAAALRETASKVGSGEEEFIKSVLEEYKTQKRAEDIV